ncbi:hypothetical protein [Candidatus Venteria ishoeyi]|uniref:Uncharacterized protein n=1 Tax=Candidatus Venteria ishoeyi TaxID=1899563 RepID=A0A1H6FCG0_9GAMM|nr:hypothetical protein [Candidatus Venteria ishoeyi]SEH07313.1 Uncharacterised protein [Candidatus Venteria ishoeyi]
MNAMTIETSVMADHQLHLNLPASLPVGCKLRVVIEPLEPSPETDPLDWPLSDKERAVWEELPTFCAEHPMQIASLENK